jgi:hypothetical protein
LREPIDDPFAIVAPAELDVDRTKWNSLVTPNSATLDRQDRQNDSEGLRRYQLKLTALTLALQWCRCFLSAIPLSTFLMGPLPNYHSRSGGAPLSGRLGIFQLGKTRPLSLGLNSRRSVEPSSSILRDPASMCSSMSRLDIRRPTLPTRSGSVEVEDRSALLDVEPTLILDSSGSSI